MKKQIVPVVPAAIINEENKFLMTKRVDFDLEDYHFYHLKYLPKKGKIGREYLLFIFVN